jgi:integrase
VRRPAAQEIDADTLVFPAKNGLPLRQENVRRRVLKRAAEEADVAWIGFHTFRHTCASLLFAAGRNVKQVQRWLGHHSPAFTLDRYVHLLDDGIGGGLDLTQELAEVATPVATDATPNHRTQPDTVPASIAL